MDQQIRFANTTYSSHGNIKLVIDGFLYVKNKMKKNTYNWECDLRKYQPCQGKAVTILDGNKHQIEHTSVHSHGPDPARIVSCDVTHRAKQRSRTTREKPVQVVQNVMRSVPAEILPETERKSLVIKTVISYLKQLFEWYSVSIVYRN
jgi:hypothetical protein